jgi:hypothetical protein
MRSEESMDVGLPLPPRSPYFFTLSHTQRDFGHGGGEHCKKLQTCRKKNIEHHSTGFPNWVPG